MRKLASPRNMSRLSPINSILTKSNEMQKKNLNIDTEAQQHLLKYAAQKENIAMLKESRLND